MKEHLVDLAASVTLSILFSLAAIWGWNHLFDFVKVFSYDLENILAVMAISFIFSGTRINS